MNVKTANGEPDKVLIFWPGKLGFQKPMIVSSAGSSEEQTQQTSLALSW
jgi:hypothetical protein